jgi:hypothetical protein
VIDRALPDHAREAHDLLDVRAGLETAGLVLANAGDARALDVFAAVDTWERQANMVRSPVVDRRRRDALGGLGDPPRTQDDLDLDAALEVAHAALAEVGCTPADTSEARSRT